MSRKAVSPVVGFILILAIISLTMAIIQSTYVPAWSKEVEWKSFEKLTSQVSKIPEILTSSTSTSLSLQVGVSYPKYPLLYTPPPVAGYVEFVPENVTINGTIVSGEYFNKSFTTSAIVIHPYYIYSPSRVLTVEYTAVFENNLTLINQSAFSSTTAVIPVIEANREIVSGVKIPLNFYLLSKSTGIPLRNVSIKFETKNPSYWARILKAIYSNVSVSGDVVTINASSLTLYLPCWYVSTVKATPSFNRYVYALVPLNSKVYVTAGSTVPVRVMVTDQYGNPYAGVNVTASVVYGATYVSVSPLNVTSNLQGIATFYVRGLNAGNATIEFKAGNASVNVSVAVLPLPIPTATPVPTTIEFLSGNNLTLLSYNSLNYIYTASLNVSVKVLDASGNPVAGVPVTITLNVLYYNGGGKGGSLLSSPAYTNVVVTDSSGVAKITDLPITVPLSTNLSYKSAYTQLSASCAGITTSCTNYTPIASYFGGSIKTLPLPYTITYP